MAWMICTGNCIACGRLFNFNPDKVPSLRVEGKREPVCENCMRVANEKRKEAGLPPHPILPDAYEAEEVP